MNSCLSCHQPLGEHQELRHGSCTRNLFGKRATPLLEYSLKDIERIAADWLATHSNVTGVQPKLSLHWKREDGIPRLTVIGALEGEYILKVPYEKYPHMPELEALCMNMARACIIPTVPFGLIHLQDGALCYITRRIDRSESGKTAMEDMCQLSLRQTEDKYKGSHEQVAKLIQAYSARPLFDVVRFYETVLFSFLIGNNDMHLKNFSLYAPKKDEYKFTPAYDLISSQLLLPSDDEDLALNLNGRKKKLKRLDFEEALREYLTPKAIENLFKRIEEGTKKWPELIDNSFLPEGMKESFKVLIKGKRNQIGQDKDRR